MKKPSRLDYAYAVGRVRALEKGLVERAVFSEASEEKGFSNALKVIFDAGHFPEDMVQIENSEGLDEFIEKEESFLFRLMKEILLEKDILKIFLEENYPKSVVPDAESMDYPFIQDYIRHEIDLGNLKILFRLKYLGFSKDKFEALMGKGGFLDEKALLQNFDSSFAEIGERLQATPYGELWTKAADTLELDETFVDLERGIEDFLMIYLRKAKHIVFGPEPVFAYGLAKKRELRLVRLLGVGMLNRVPHEILSKRISETYV